MNLWLVRLAVRLAFKPTAEHRWRLLALSIATAIVTISGLAILGGLQLMQAQADRGQARSPVQTTDVARTRTLLADTADQIAGRQYSVIYLEPAHDPGQAAVPPGLASMPAPGQAVLSPRLAQLAGTDPAIATRYPNRAAQPIAAAGLRNPDELLAYVRPSTAHALARSDRARRLTGFGGAGLLRSGADVVVPYLQTAQGEEVLLGNCPDLDEFLAHTSGSGPCALQAPTSPAQLDAQLRRPDRLQRLPDTRAERGPILGAAYAMDVSRAPADALDRIPIRGFYVLAGTEAQPPPSTARPSRISPHRSFSPSTSSSNI